jgi:hypothetical protein
MVDPRFVTRENVIQEGAIFVMIPAQKAVTYVQTAMTVLFRAASVVALIVLRQ